MQSGRDVMYGTWRAQPSHQTQEFNSITATLIQRPQILPSRIFKHELIVHVLPTDWEMLSGVQYVKAHPKVLFLLFAASLGSAGAGLALLHAGSRALPLLFVVVLSPPLL